MIVLTIASYVRSLEEEIFMASGFNSFHFLKIKFHSIMFQTINEMKHSIVKLRQLKKVRWWKEKWVMI